MLPTFWNNLHDRSMFKMAYDVAYVCSSLGFKTEPTKSFVDAEVCRNRCMISNADVDIISMRTSWV